MHELTPTVTALIDRIIPADDWPSASQNNVVNFLWKLLGGELAHEQAFVFSGLRSLDAEAVARGGDSFSELGEAAQDALLRDIERDRTLVSWDGSAARWFELLVRLTNEGYYADRGNGANLEHASWRMVGYDARRPI